MEKVYKEAEEGDESDRIVQGQSVRVSVPPHTS